MVSDLGPDLDHVVFFQVVLTPVECDKQVALIVPDLDRGLECCFCLFLFCFLLKRLSCFYLCASKNPKNLLTLYNFHFFD